MSDETVIRQWRSADNADAPWFVVFDATVSEDVTLESKVTEDPVANGSPINDHMYDLPDKLVLMCEVGDVPTSDVYKALDGRSLAQAQADGVSTIDPLTGISLDYATPRSVQALVRLDTMRLAHEPFYIQTGLRLFKNVVCTKIHYTTDTKNGRALAFTADLQAVRIVNTQAVIYPVTKVPKKGSRPVDSGHVDTPPLTGLEAVPDKEKRTSILKKMLTTGKFDASAFVGVPKNDTELAAQHQGSLVPGAG